jgi:hypothetical protein
VSVGYENDVPKSWTSQEEVVDGDWLNHVRYPSIPMSRYQAVSFESTADQSVLQQRGRVSAPYAATSDVEQSTNPELEEQNVGDALSEDATLHPALANHPEVEVISVLVWSHQFGQVAEA